MNWQEILSQDGALKSNKFISPIFVLLPRKKVKDKKVILNLNNYRNWNHFLSNDIKKAYKNYIKEQLSGVKFDSSIIIILQYFKKNNRITDKANVLSIHEKFFCDAMVELGCIKDDNDNYIKYQIYLDTIIDKENPRVEITVLH